MAHRTSHQHPDDAIGAIVTITCNVPEAAMIVAALDGFAFHWNELARNESMPAMRDMCKQTADAFAKLSADITGPLPED